PYLKTHIHRCNFLLKDSAKKCSKLSWRSCRNLLNESPCSLSWKTYIGLTQRPSNCWGSCLTRHPRRLCLCCSHVVRIFNLPGIIVRISPKSQSIAYPLPRWHRSSHV